MTESANTELVQQAYAAFGRGDIAAVLNTVDDNVTWEAVLGAPPSVPTAGRRQGRAGVQEFFETLLR